MKLPICALALLSMFLAMPLAAQQPDQPKYFVWLGMGANGFDNAALSGIGGFGYRIGDGLYGLTNIITTSKRSTLSESLIKYVTQQGPVTLFALGEIGISTGEGTAQSSYGAGGGIMLDVLKRISSKIQNLQVIGVVKIVRTPDLGPNVVKPQFVGGVVYLFGGK